MPRNVLRQTRTEKPHSDCRHRSLRTEAFPRVTPATVSVVFNPCASTSSIPSQSLRGDTGMSLNTHARDTQIDQRFEHPMQRECLRFMARGGVTSPIVRHDTENWRLIQETRTRCSL